MMSRLEKVAIPLIVLTVVVAYAMSLLMESKAFMQHWVIREDGLLEWMTVIALFLSAVLFWSRSWLLRQSRAKLFLTCTAVYG